MSTVFQSAEEAKSFIARSQGIDPKDAEYETLEDLKVAGFDAMLLDDPGTPDEMKAAIRERMEAQKGYALKVSEETQIKIVVGPFRHGFDCWVIGDNGFAIRL